MPVTGTTTDLNSLFNEIYEEALEVAYEETIMAMLVTNYVGTGLAARKVGIDPSGNVQKVAEGTVYSGGQPWGKDLLATLEPEIYKSQFLLTQTQIDTDPDDSVARASRTLGREIAQAVDIDLLALFSGFSTDKGSAGGTMTSGIVGAALAVLQANRAGRPWNIVLHPYQWNPIWVSLGRPDTNKAFLGDIANQAMRDYAVSDWLASRWFVSANIAIDSNDDAVAGVFSREALGLDIRKDFELDVKYEGEIAGRGWRLDAELHAAVAEIRDGFGIAITSDASEPTGA